MIWIACEHLLQRAEEPHLLLLRSINRKDERPHTTAVLLLTLLFGALRGEHGDDESGTQR